MTVDPAIVPRYRRARSGRLLGGVAAGLARHLGVGVLSIRLAFVLLVTLGGFGFVLYAAFWIVVRREPLGTSATAPGLAAAERAGLRPRRRLGLAASDTGQLVGFGAVALGLGLLLQSTSIGVSPAIFWPALVAAFGVLVIWRQNDEAADAMRGAETGRASARPTWRGGLRVAVGGALVLVGVIIFLAATDRLAVAGDIVLGVAIALAGLLLVGGPWLLRLLGQLRDERTERALSEQRADVAAHLHDSVLQTLALIQRQSADPREVVRLARRQERDLRGWLYGPGPPPDSSLRAALMRVGAEAEELYGVPVETVVVGDCAVEPAVHALVQAAREAVINASRHSGAERVDVYAEVEDGEVSVFVRDRGTGFDPSSVPESRMGIRGSIVERMHRYGGTAEVRSARGEGAEVRLRISRHATAQVRTPGGLP